MRFHIQLAGAGLYQVQWLALTRNSKNDPDFWVGLAEGAILHGTTAIQQYIR